MGFAGDENGKIHQSSGCRCALYISSFSKFSGRLLTAGFKGTDRLFTTERVSNGRRWRIRTTTRASNGRANAHARTEGRARSSNVKRICGKNSVSWNDIVERSNGFISDSHSYVTDTGRKRGSITIRIPADRFIAVIDEIACVGDVKSKDTSGEDVTEEYLDLTARLNNSERQEQRLLEILDMANNTKEVLEVEREIWRVRTEIERLTGRIKYLKNRVELATISVSLYEPEPITHSWGIRDAIRSAFGGFVSVVRGLIILVGYALPILILVGFGWLVKSKLMPRLEKKREDKRENN
jgi:hypothetical protein